MSVAFADSPGDLYFFIPEIEVLQFFFVCVNFYLFLGCEDWGTQSLWLGKQGCKYGSLQPGRRLLWIRYNSWVSQKKFLGTSLGAVFTLRAKELLVLPSNQLEICLFKRKKKKKKEKKAGLWRSEVLLSQYGAHAWIQSCDGTVSWGWSCLPRSWHPTVLLMITHRLSIHAYRLSSACLISMHVCF